MNLFELSEIAHKEGSVYFTSPRWNKRVVCLLPAGFLGFVSVDYSADEGCIGNVSTEIEYGNRNGVFLNQEEELFNDDFILSDFSTAYSFKKEFEAKWKSI